MGVLSSQVYFLDQHPNPQVDEQAADRVYRRGQTHPVEIVRLNAVGTVDGPLESVKRRRLANARQFTDPLPGDWQSDDMVAELAERMDIKEVGQYAFYLLAHNTN